MDYQKSLVCEEIDKHAEKLLTLNRQIWNYAEVGKKEDKSVRAITKLLKKNDFHVTLTYKDVRTAFKAVYPNPKRAKPTTASSCPNRGPNVAFLCRYDARVKAGHVNGNNLLTEVAVGAALAVKAAIERSCPSVGCVTVIGCPDSARGGAVPLVNRGAFKNVDCVLMASPGPRTEWSPRYMARKIFRVVYKEEDKPSRAETLRPEGCDAAMIALQKLMIVREHMDPHWSANVTIGSQAVPRPNEERETLDGHTCVCLKAHTNTEMDLMERRVQPCLEGAAHALGCQMDVSYIRKTYYSFTNNQQLCYLLQLNAYHCGILATPLKPKPIMDPIDEGNISHVVPTIRPMFYIGTDAEVGTREFKEAALSPLAHFYAIATAKALAMTVVDVFNSGETMAKVKADFRSSLTEEQERLFRPFLVSRDPEYKIKVDMPYGADVGLSKAV